MKLENIINKIKKRFRKISVKPEEYYIDIGDFRLDFSFFSMENEFCDTLRYSVFDPAYCGSTFRIKSKVEGNIQELLDLMYNMNMFDELTIQPAGIVLQNAFISQVDIKQDWDGMSILDMTLQCDNFYQGIEK